MLCKKCGSQLLKDSKFCSNCGVKVEITSTDFFPKDTEELNSQPEYIPEEECNQSLNQFIKKSKKILSKLFSGGLVSIASRITFFVGIALFVVLLIWGGINNAKEQDSGNYSDELNSGGYNDYYIAGIDKSIGLSLKIDSIETRGSYTYVNCTVTNVSSEYVATRYRYVKVKAQFKDYYGSIVDTDWTYAVDSTWLEPGESKTFYYMVKNTTIESAILSFID